MPMPPAKKTTSATRRARKRQTKWTSFCGVAHAESASRTSKRVADLVGVEDGQDQRVDHLGGADAHVHEASGGAEVVEGGRGAGVGVVVNCLHPQLLKVASIKATLAMA
jgi:hypothetical protein